MVHPAVAWSWSMSILVDSDLGVGLGQSQSVICHGATDMAVSFRVTGPVQIFEQLS